MHLVWKYYDIIFLDPLVGHIPSVPFSFSFVSCSHFAPTQNLLCLVASILPSSFLSSLSHFLYCFRLYIALSMGFLSFSFPSFSPPSFLFLYLSLSFFFPMSLDLSQHQPRPLFHSLHLNIATLYLSFRKIIRTWPPIYFRTLHFKLKEIPLHSFFSRTMNNRLQKHDSLKPLRSVELHLTLPFIFKQWKRLHFIQP